MKHFSGVGQALLGALLLAAVSTLGDFIWARWLVHKTLYGIVHGALMCLCIGWVLGRCVGGGRVQAMGALISLLIGVLASAAFYGLAKFMGWYAMFVCWMAIWIALGMLDRHLRGKRESVAFASLRGFLAATLSGAGFYPIYLLWTSPDAPNYAVFFLAWTVAFLPGFLCLLVRRTTV